MRDYCQKLSCTSLPFKTRFCWALLIFVAANCYLNTVDRSKGIAPDTIREQLFDYAGTEESPKYLNGTANVVLLGSSLFLHPEWAVDRKLPITEPWGKVTIVSESHYHLAQGLGNELARAGFQDPYVYNLAAGGALISDSYLLLFHYLKNHPKPAVVVLDCAPRSFSDTGVTEANATPIFDYCFQLQDFPELHSTYLRSRDAKANYFLAKLFFTYHHRKWLCESSENWLLQRLTEGIETLPSRSTAGATAVLASGGEKVPLAAETEAALRMKKSLHEYRDRYLCISRERLEPQLRYLKRIEDLCAEKQIKLIVVNMPLSKQNRELLSAGFYSDFRADVAKSLGARAVFIDLASSDDWPASLYHDSVHLNDQGGARLNQVIADAITRGSWQAHSITTVNQ